MAVARKHLTDEAPRSVAGPRARPRSIRQEDVFDDSHNPVAEHLFRLEDAFASEAGDETARYPGRVRLAILIAAPLGAWGLVALAAIGLHALF